MEKCETAERKTNQKMSNYSRGMGNEEFSEIMMEEEKEVLKVTKAFRKICPCRF